MDFSSAVAEATRKRLDARFGARAEAWWERLPEVTERLAARWELIIGDPVGRGNTSLVIRCQNARLGPLILKLVPDETLAGAEAAALRSWEPSGHVPRVWGHDGAAGAVLLEAIPKEMPLGATRAQVKLSDVAELIDSLHRSGSPVLADGVVPLAERVEFIYGFWIERHSRDPEVTHAVPVTRLDRGRGLARALAARKQDAPVLLHGDLHPGNVLDGGVNRGLVAIDPRPCVGDPAFDTVDWVFWLTDDPQCWESRARDLAAALSVEYQRVLDWCAAFAAMLAAGKAARGESAGHIEALLRLAP
jgi:streptomycin 6-kinase